MEGVIGRLFEFAKSSAFWHSDQKKITDDWWRPAWKCWSIQ